jgi:hypothetical protein
MKLVLLVSLTCAQGVVAQTPAPTNDAPNPYKTVTNFFQLPEGPFVGIDQHGRAGPRRALDLDRRPLRSEFLRRLEAAGRDEVRCLRQARAYVR